MKLNIFLDTNVFLDSLLKRDNGEARELLKFIVNTPNVNGFLSDLSIANIHYISKKKFSEEYIRYFIKYLMKYFNIISIDKDIIIKTIESDFKDFEDGLQYFSAKKFFCDYIITKNTKDFKNSNIEILETKDFLKIIQK